uniref:Uncharacterized protein n=1 Tax=Arundo donax TaxID=35708 RepID=A0A0A8XSG2_ARUDO
MRFQFDPATILIRRCGQTLLDVLVPENQLVLNEKVKDKSIYLDNITGPAACIVYSLHLPWATSMQIKTDTKYWEILDMLEISIKGRWWNTLEDILEHPLFYRLEKKYTAITCYMWTSTPNMADWHGVRGIFPRKRNIPHQQFVKEFAANFFFHKEYTVKNTGSNEYHVTSKMAKHKKTGRKCTLTWTHLMINMSDSGRARVF